MTQNDMNLDAIKNTVLSSVLIYGLEGGLATEIGKNLALSGINIFLFDNHIITNNDLETGIYYNNINISSATVLCSKLQKLNSSIIIKSVNNIYQKQDITILINQPKNFILEVNNICRQNNSKLIVLYSKGINGCIFVDAGYNHIITDITGYNIEPVQISEINNNRIICNTTFNFESGDYVSFNNLEGTNLNQFKKEWQIKVINKKTIELVDCNLKDFTFINGTIYHIKKPITVNHQLLSEISTEDKIVNNYLNGISDDYELMPIISLFGSLVASEAIKLVSNKYIPINQWFSWEDLELKPKGNFNCYSRLGKMYGPEFEDKLLNSKWLIVGSGDIGCEHLKNLAFMGVRDIIITDSELIRTPNLLFSNDNINEFKSDIAAKVINNMKPINIKSYHEKVGNVNDFTDKILPQVSGVFNALNNDSARRFMDEQCFKYGIPLFESKTSGTKGYTQPIIPFITDTYSASNNPEQDISFPLCTIKSFPNDIQHTIYWAMEQFEFFNKTPSTLNSNNEYDNKINECYKKYPAHKNKLYCIKYAIDTFYENYYNIINELLKSFPPDHVIDNKLFWSCGKKCPKPIELNINNKLHMQYIISTTQLFAITLNINYEFTEQEILNYIINRKIIDSDNNNISYNSQEFNKYNYYHTSWINAASNMRALNYNIPIVSETKENPYKIITSTVSGLIMIEMIKYLLNVKEYRSTFINLVKTQIIYTKPLAAPMMEIAGKEINSWTKFNYTLNSTLQEFKEYYEKIFNTIITMITNGSTILYADFIDNNINKNLKDIIDNNATLTIMTDDNVNLPNISIKFT
jgi:molybdopterin/thiamine biosynthesis adenylyltransferase